MSTAATRRLHRELQLVQREPSWGVSAAPLSEDLYTWHCNVAGQPPAGGAPVILHLELTFSAEAWRRRSGTICEAEVLSSIYYIFLLGYYQGRFTCVLSGRHISTRKEP